MASKRQTFVIIGGGSAGWMMAAALAHATAPSCDITLIESEEIGTIGVGEATIPPIKYFNQRLGIDETTFIKETQGSFKLGIEFVDWTRRNHSYFHPFGQYGAEFDFVPFYHFWTREHLNGHTIPIDDYCMAWAAARGHKFEPPARDKRMMQSRHDYAYHFDATLYARFLRRFAEVRGVKRIEGKVTSALQYAESGYIQSVTLEDGRVIDGDFFIDCTGFFGLLIEKTMKTGYEDWSHWLPCNRAVAVRSELNGPIFSHTISTAKSAGWQWRIPLQHRTGNGYVYCGDYLDADTAEQSLLADLDGAPLSDPLHLRFVTGRRKKFWNKNCLAVGLSAGFMEPLESTSLHLIQYGIMRFLAMLPGRDFSPLLAEEYNRLTTTEYERIRDFLILHYHATERDDSPFWDYVRTMPIPDTLSYKIDHFRSHGLVIADERDLFANPSWVAVYLGQNIIPQKAPAITHLRENIPVTDRMADIHRAVNEAADAMLSHDDFITRYCAAAQ